MQAQAMVAVVAGVVLSASIITYQYVQSLRGELINAQESLELCRLAREADASAMSAYENIRSEADKTAKERRNALEKISPDASADDVFRACRDGLCPSGEARRPGTTGIAVDSLRTAKDAGKHDERQQSR